MNSTTLSPKASLAKLALYPKPRPFKVMVLGQSEVGKSALVVRFITRRFIGEYDPNLEKIYSFQTVIDNETVRFEILDSAGYDQGSEYSHLESNIRWAEAFILMYSVTDKCSFDECHRLKFLINYIKKRRRLASPMKDSIPETPVVLVGNKTDQGGDRMVTTDEGQRRSKEIGCVCFHEISVRESIEQVCSVFRDARRFWRVGSRWSRDVHSALSRPLARAASETSDSTINTMPYGNSENMNSTTLSPKASLAKLALYPKPRPFKVMVLGQSEVGKSALVVRFITRRFIGEYDPNLEKIYSFQTVIDNETVRFEILDSAGYDQGSEYSHLESNIRWAEAFILMYSVTDKCSFDECHRLKFLINYIKKRRRLASPMKDSIPETPVVLVGNKTDQGGDRMVTTDEGQRRSKEIGCVCFHEISVRESIEQVCSVFRDARRFWRVGSRWSRDVHSALSRPLARAASETSDSTINTMPCQRYTEIELDEEEEVSLVRCDSTSSSGLSECTDEFRARASTDSRLPPRPERQRHPPSTRPLPPPVRRMSVAMRGNNASTY